MNMYHLIHLFEKSNRLLISNSNLHFIMLSIKFSYCLYIIVLANKWNWFL